MTFVTEAIQIKLEKLRDSVFEKIFTKYENFTKNFFKIAKHLFIEHLRWLPLATTRTSNLELYSQKNLFSTVKI